MLRAGGWQAAAGQQISQDQAQLLAVLEDRESVECGLCHYAPTAVNIWQE